MASILVVDDHADTRDVLARYLADAGFEVVEAGNGWEALLSLDERPTDLILLDVMMPGMDGATFMKILRGAKRTQDLPVVVMTAYGDSPAARQVASLGADAMIAKRKGFMDEVLPAIRSALEGRTHPHT